MAKALRGSLMKVYKGFALAAFLAAVFCLSSCKSDDDSTPFTGIRLCGKMTVGTESTLNVIGTFYNEGIADSSVEISYEVSDSSLAFLSPSTAASGTAVTITTGTSEGYFTLTAAATVNGTNYSESKTITVSDATVISASDTPVGYAAIDTSKIGASSDKIVTVTTKSDLVKYAKDGGYLIYVNGDIDFSDGLIPSSGSKSTDSTSAMDSFVAANSSYSTYNAWLKGETNVGSSADTSTSAISNKYKAKIQVQLASNTAIIGINNPILRGASFSVRKIDNIVIRNITVQDTIDPFPHHEDGDGWNAQHDAISIDNATNVWIDHCTLADTLKLGTAANGEKWQVYDGLCDMKGNSTANITVSYTKFYNHDKTMLIGSSDSDGDNSMRKITLHHNYFLDCGQRLPMVRNSTIHIFNNVYDTDSNRYYIQQYAVGVRKGSVIYAENNYFGSGIKYSFKDSYGTLYSSGNNGSTINSTVSGSTLFSSAVNAYSYSLDSASDAKTSVTNNAGAGVWSVKQ